MQMPPIAVVHNAHDPSPEQQTAPPPTLKRLLHDMPTIIAAMSHFEADMSLDGLQHALSCSARTKDVFLHLVITW
jgi:hypothetical protein